MILMLGHQAGACAVPAACMPVYMRVIRHMWHAGCNRSQACGVPLAPALLRTALTCASMRTHACVHELIN